jgi:4-hydroxybenzoate polyprenyltransferase
MSRWFTYLKERSPLQALLIVGASVSGSGVMLAALLTGRPFDVRAFVLGLVAQLLFLLVLRVMDERKDYEKDKVAHPTRPLPRGLISVAEIERAIVGGMSAMVALAGASAAAVNPTAGAVFAVGTAYLWLMYREFYIGKKLGDYPMLYAISHQIILFPIYGFPIALAAPELIFSPAALAFVAANLGASMTYEIARKLDPAAPAILKTYRSIYGPGKTAALAAAFVALSAVFAYQMHLQAILWPIEALMLLALGYVLAKPEKFKVAEGVAGLSTLVHLVAIPIAIWARLLP